MNVNPGDKLRVIKEVFDKSRILNPGTVLEVIWSKGKSMSHIRRCIDEKGRTRYIHMQDVDDGCYEKTFAAPELPKTVEFVQTFVKPSEIERKLLAQVAELKNSQNILAKEKAREISMILESKEALEQEIKALKERPEASAHSQDLVDRLKASMRTWVLAIQFSPSHTAMRKEIQAFLKEL